MKRNYKHSKVEKISSLDGESSPVGISTGVYGGVLHVAMEQIILLIILLINILYFREFSTEGLIIINNNLAYCCCCCCC